MSSRVEIILGNTPFPGAGQQIGGHHVIESMVDVEGKNWAIYLKGKLNQSQVKKALAELTSKHHALPVKDEFSLLSFKSKGMLHARTNPPGDVTVVRGHMYYARPNPITPSAFQAEMDEMIIDDPEKHFTKYAVNNTKELHERLWKGVSYAGESYGWKKGNELWHRRASFIMPKIKINKALKGATMFYHTHPAKDEPSLTSADDIQFYLDLHFAYGIKSFYTIMKHKLDHFTITGKPGGKEKYLRMEEEAFIDTVDGMIEKGEKVAKKEVGKDRPEVEFQNRITKEMVDLFNKKFKSIAKISFRPKSKNPASKLARKSSNNPIAALINPAPNPPIKVDDKYIAKALDELKGLDYAHEHYGADEYGHTMYVYWWLKHHLAPTPKQPKGRLYKLQEYGLDQESRGKVRAYLSQPIIGNYNYMDAVYLMALYHDIAKLREKGVKQSGWEIGAEMFRNEIGPELGLPSKLIEDIAFLFDTDLGRKGITDEDFRTQAGDYYGAAKLVQMSDMITHHPLMYTGSARKAKESGKIGMASGKQYKEYIMTELINDLRNFLDHHYVIQNPPPKVGSLKWVADYGLEDIPMEAAQELLGEFDQSVIPDNDGKTKPPGDRSSGGHLYRMRFNPSVVPGLTRYYAGNLSLSSSKLLIDVGRPVPDDLGKADVNLIYRAVGERLRESYPEVIIEEMEPESLVNPRHANKIQVICLSGPSGGGKSTVLRHLNQNIPNSSTPPTYTTRPRRASDGQDRMFVSKAQFKDMIERGEFVEYTVSGAGHYYGRRFKDFLGNVAIIEVTLDGKKHYEKLFANVFTVYLDPDPSITEEERAKAIYKRGGLTKEEAKRRAKKATETVARSKKMQFDLRVTMMRGKYHEGAKKVLSEIPLVNPSADFTLLRTGYEQPYQFALDGTLAPLSSLEVNRNRQIQKFNAEQQAAYNAKTHVPWHHMDRDSFVQGSIIPPKWFHDRPGAYKYGLIPVSAVTGMGSLTDFSENPPKKDQFDWFKDWVELVNMKNKELKTFLDSDWGKVAGLSPEEAKKLGINSGRTSGRRILKMRKKLGLTGPKDYIDPNKPRVLEDYYATALDKWSGPPSKKGTDWYWCKHQVMFNKRFMGDVFGERKGPLVRKQKTQNQPSRRLLGLWVWGHDPWRYARKVEKRERMPKCPSVPWVGMTEKRKWGVIEVIPGPRKNPTQKKECPLPPKKGIIIYGAKWCKWCNEARKYLDEKNKKYDYVDIDTVKNYQKNIFPLTDNYRYIPVIFIDGKFIGGYSELVARKNPKVRVKKDEYRSYYMDEEGNDLTGIPFDGATLSAEEYLIDLGESIERSEATRIRRGDWHRIGMAAYKGKESIIEVAPATMQGSVAKSGNFSGIGSRFQVRDSLFFKDFFTDAVVFPTIFTHMADEPSSVLLVQGKLIPKGDPEIRSDVTDWQGNSKGYQAKVYDYGTIKSLDWVQNIVTFKPSKDELVMENHHHNRTTNETKQVWTIRLSDKGEYLWLEEILIHPDFRGQGRLEDVLWMMVYELPYLRVPDYPEQKPIRTLARVVEGIPQEALVKALKKVGFKELERVDGGILMELDLADWKSPYSNPHYTPSPGIAMFPGELHQGPAALYQQTISISQLNPPRSKPFPWNKARVAKSPFKTMKKAQASLKAWKEGRPIGFTATTSLKSMGKIPRVSGKYELGEKYERINPNHCPIEAEARRAATDPSFNHHEWYIEHHLDYVMAIAKSIVHSDEPEDQQLIHDMVWMHDYPKMMGDKDNYELVRELVSKHRSERYTDRLMNQLRWMEAIKSPDWNGRATTIAAVMSTADALAHYYGPFFQIFHDENPDTPIAVLKKKNQAKLEKDKLKLRAGPRRTALDNVKLKYNGRKVKVVGNEHIAELIERKNPRTKKGRKFPSKYLKGLTATEKAIAKYEIDRGYEYSMDDPKAYEDWRSDIKAKARGLKPLPSKWRNKFARKYGSLKKGYDFLDRMSKTTGVKRKYLKKIQDKGLAAWRVGHRPGVTPMQWARGRVYAFVMAAPSSTGPGKPDHKLAVEAGVR